MEEKNQQPTIHSPGASDLETIKDIRHMMQRSSRFISLSGLSGIAAGIFALIGAFVAMKILDAYYGPYNSSGIFSGDDFSK
ncbi:MAG TPA: hypothetical protein VLJ68_12595, partial [Chitinophagaceae bacterium]|nr:hypothetical protein [Chitinophagaceae bacterium]